MKLVTIKYGPVSIRWQYIRPDETSKLHKREVVEENLTKAFLEKGEGKNKTIIKEVVVKKHPKDLDNKEAARKFALTKLVAESFTRDGDLKDRIIVWDAYKNRIPKKEA